MHAIVCDCCGKTVTEAVNIKVDRLMGGEWSDYGITGDYCKRCQIKLVKALQKIKSEMKAEQDQGGLHKFDDLLKDGVMSYRLANFLHRNVVVVGDDETASLEGLTEWTAEKLLRRRGMGETLLNDLRRIMALYGLSLSGESTHQN